MADVPNSSVVAKEIIAKLRSNMKLESPLVIDLPITEYEVQMILDRHTSKLQYLVNAIRSVKAIAELPKQEEDDNLFMVLEHNSAMGDFEIAIDTLIHAFNLWEAP